MSPRRLIPPRLRCSYHRFRLWLLDHMPPGVLAEPFATFIALLCLISGLPIVLHTSEPGPIEALLPHALVTGWGVVLFAGGVGMLAGILSIKRLPGGHHLVTRVPVYRLGLRLLGISSVVYGYAVASVAGVAATGLVVVLSLFALTTWLRLLTFGGR